MFTTLLNRMEWRWEKNHKKKPKTSNRSDARNTRKVKKKIFEDFCVLRRSPAPFTVQCARKSKLVSCRFPSHQSNCWNQRFCDQNRQSRAVKLIEHRLKISNVINSDFCKNFGFDIPSLSTWHKNLRCLFCYVREFSLNSWPCSIARILSILFIIFSHLHKLHKGSSSFAGTKLDLVKQKQSTKYIAKSEGDMRYDMTNNAGSEQRIFDMEK